MPRVTEIIAKALGATVVDRPGDVPLIVMPQKKRARKARAEKTYPLRLTYAEMELLVRATHSGNAEVYCDELAEDFHEQTERAAKIRAKVCDKLNEIDAQASVKS